MKKLVYSFVMLFCFVFFGSMLTTANVVAAAGGPSEQDMIHMVVEGKEIEPEVPPVISNGRTLVPVRVIAEGLGAEVTWDEKSRKATIVREKNRVELQLNNKRAVVNGKQVLLDAPPVIKNSRMLLPLRFVGEALGSTIGWEPSTRTVVANRTVSLQVNGKDVSHSLKSYKLDGTVFLPVQKIAENLGLPSADIAGRFTKRVIDSNVLVALPEVEQLVGGRVEWNAEKNQVIVERVNELKEISIRENTVSLQTKNSDSVKPEVLVLQAPHRIVLDLPNMVLSDSMRNQDEEIRPENTADSTAADHEKPADIPGETDDADKLAEQQSVIKGIRYSQYSVSPYTVRVVVEVTGKSDYKLVNTQNGLDIQLLPKPKKTGFLIVVDAGHGGKDNGATGVTGYREKQFNLNVANRVVELLKQNPKFQVVATRTTDVFLELKERVEIANNLEADLFLSIHANSFKPQARGTETFYYNKYSENFARVVHRHLLEATNFPDRKVQVSGFYVIKHTKMPAVLTETGFLSNSIENAELTSPEFQEKVAQALADAINEYYNSYH